MRVALSVLSWTLASRGKIKEPKSVFKLRWTRSFLNHRHCESQQQSHIGGPGFELGTHVGICVETWVNNTTDDADVHIVRLQCELWMGEVTQGLISNACPVVSVDPKNGALTPQERWASSRPIRCIRHCVRVCVGLRVIEKRRSPGSRGTRRECCCAPAHVTSFFFSSHYG